MITRVRVKNFRSLADVDVTLGPLTVLVGRNGAGKSAFVDALCFVRDALRSGISEALSKRNGLGMLRTRPYSDTSKEMSFHVWIEYKEFRGEYGFAIAQSEEDSMSIAFSPRQRFLWHIPNSRLAYATSAAALVSSF